MQNVITHRAGQFRTKRQIEYSLKYLQFGQRIFRWTFLLFIISFNCSLTAQKKSKNKTLSSFDLYFGSRTYINNFYNQFNTINKIDFSAPIKVIGVGTSGQFVVTRGSNFYGHFIYNQIIPQTVTVQDTVKGKVSGFIFSFAYGGAITTKSNIFALYYYLGINTGRLKLYDNQLLNQKNPFLSPKIGIQPKVRLGKMTLGFVFDYDYDLSKNNWRKMTFSSSGDKININTFKQTAITSLISIGYLY